MLSECEYEMTMCHLKTKTKNEMSNVTVGGASQTFKFSVRNGNEFKLNENKTNNFISVATQ